MWRHLASGLEEAALGLSRTLIEIDLNMKLVVQDPTERMAKRLAAFHNYGYQMHGQKILSDHDTRKKVLNKENGLARTVEVARSYVRFLEEPVFNCFCRSSCVRKLTAVRCRCQVPSYRLGSLRVGPCVPGLVPLHSDPSGPFVGDQRIAAGGS